MSLLAHATFAAHGLERERRLLDAHIKSEVVEAKRIQRETGCSWSAALAQAYSPLPVVRRQPR